MDEFIEPLFSEYEKSFILYKNLITTKYDIKSYPPAFAEYQSFGKDFPGGLIHKPQYNNCIFIGSEFDSADGALSRFHQCIFDGCHFNNCDLRYCDIFESFFKAEYEDAIINSCNYSFGNFINSNFDGIHFSGCSFRQMQFENTSFINTTMQYCSIEQSSISNCTFDNLDLRKVSIRYCTFENITFNAVTIHILDLAKNYGLIQELQKCPSKISIAYKSNELMTLNDAIVYLKQLVPYYYETGKFYELINVYAINDDYDKILEILPSAFERVISLCDFATLQDLCTLIVRLNICNNNQLRDFYNVIKQLINPDKFPHYLRKSYNSYIENIRYILTENPHNNPRADILLKTNIDSLEDYDMGQLLMSIEANIKEIAPSVDTTIKLTHHSPYDVAIAICGALPEILMICQIFYYCLGGAKSFSDLKGSRRAKTKKKIEDNSSGAQKTNDKSSKRIEFFTRQVFYF